MDLLPVELLHIIFNYFLAQDILFSFSNVSNYIDTILLAYSSYQINFKSITKANFDLICHCIRPDQVLSLILSDDIDTPGQSELFFSYFQIEQFIHLQSLTLFNIELDILESIISNLDKLSKLHSFSFYSKDMKRKYPTWINDYTYKIDEINYVISKTYKKILPQLRRLNRTYDFHLNEIFFPYLNCLILEESTVEKLQIIIYQTPKLKSLNVGLIDDILNIETLDMPYELNRLTLKITSKYIDIYFCIMISKSFYLSLIDASISMDQMEQFLPNLHNLKHLTIESMGSNDLTDGYRWKRLNMNYITFNIKITVKIINIQQMLNSFRTSFWLQVKHWYMAYDHESLFSISKFAPKYVLHSYNPRYFTAPNKNFLYNNIIQLNISTHDELAMQKSYGNFNNVQILKFQHRNLRYLELFLFGTNRTQYINSNLSDSIWLLSTYLHEMSHCSTLIIDTDMIPYLIDKLSKKQFKQIRTLKIRSSTSLKRPILEEILYIFPHVECLHITSIISYADMIRLIDGFKYLSNAVFTIQWKFFSYERNIFNKQELFIRGVRRLKNGTFTCRLIPSIKNNLSCSVHIWINTHVNFLRS